MSDNVQYKIIIYGSAGVGKSALVIQFTQNHFLSLYDPTIEDSYRKQLVIEGKTFILEIIDTAGQSEYHHIENMEQYMTYGQGFIIVYSITCRESFENAKLYYQRILQIRQVNYVPTCFVGNKEDLDDERQVSTEEAERWAKLAGISFFETSALSNYNVKEIFRDIIQQIYRLHYVPSKVKHKRRTCSLY